MRLGEKAGNSRRLAAAWNGGSLVIGGAAPAGRGTTGLSVLTMMPSLVKCSVSYAISRTCSWVSGSHAPPYRWVCAIGHVPRSEFQMPWALWL
jgi:hypothetical protein